MRAFVKILLVAGVLISWVAVFFIQKIFATDAFSIAFYVEMFAVFLIWLTPFTLLLLFAKEKYHILASFALGAAGFFILSQSFYVSVGFLLLGLGFFYWQAQVKQAIDGARAFSVWKLLEGMGLFFTTLSLFVALFYFDSPFGKSAPFEPNIPKGMYDVFYDQVSSSSLFQMPANAPGVKQEKIKSSIYEQTNAAFRKMAMPYIQYFSIIFAAGLFLALRGFFFPFKYILVGVIYVATKLLLALGVLRKQTIQVDKEVIEFV